MKHLREIILFYVAFVGWPFSLFSESKNQLSVDSLESLFYQQWLLFPQEKIYAQIDKPSYIAGEDIWFRAHLVEAQTHRPDTTSRYVYAELINPLKNVVQRVKVRQEDQAYHGYIPTAEDLPEGDYCLRFYTRYMEGIGDDYFFKRNIRIGAPLSGFYRVEASFDHGSQMNVGLELRFTEVYDGSFFLPEKIRLTVEKGKVRNLKTDPQGKVQTSFKYSPKDTPVLYLEYEYKGKMHAQYIPVPVPDDDFEVSFFPEGGAFPAHALTKIAFKSVNSQGLGEDIEGELMNRNGDVLQRFSSQHLGMGYFWCMSAPGESLSVVCRNGKGQEKTFSLPVAEMDALSLQLNPGRENIHVLINHSPEWTRAEDLYLAIHSRGNYLATIPWPADRKMVVLPQELFPSGVIHLLLVNEKMEPVSERLLFHIDPEERVDLAFSTDRPSYGKRDQVEVSVSLKDKERNPLTGNVSVSVTDDNDILPDRSMNIYSSLLLTSELKGYIEDPASYFSKDSPREQIENLDVLMLTQGWRRYRIDRLLQGEPEEARGFMEGSSFVTGTVKDGLQLNRPAAGYIVSLHCFQYGLFEETETDEKGVFRLENFELPDSVQCVVQSKTKKGKKGGLLTIDDEVFPAVGDIYPFIMKEEHKVSLESYFRKADDLFIQSNGMRVIHLKDVIVTGKKKRKSGSVSEYASENIPVYTTKDIEKRSPVNIYELLNGFPEVVARNKYVAMRPNMTTPLVFIDGMETYIDDLDIIGPNHVESVEVYRGADATVFGMKGQGGVIRINTKKGIDPNYTKQNFHVKTVSPLGFQFTKEFYSPVYETPKQKNSVSPDLRTTIYWNPDLKITDEGKCTFDFYTADQPGTYSVVIEGVTQEGLLIHSVEKIYYE